MVEVQKFETILLTIDEVGVCSLTLNRPEVHNAFNEIMIEEISQALESVDDHPGIRVLTLRGAGKSFCAGADINWMRRMADYSEAQNVEDAGKMSSMMHRLYQFPRPTVAMIHGNVFGGGVGLVACCDIAIASEETIFSLSEVKIGLIPSVISPYVVEAIGVRNARRYFLTGERFNAATAFSLGLIHEWHDSEHFHQSDQKILKELLQSAPSAQTTAKAQLQNVVAKPITPELRDETIRMIANVRASDEGREGTSAFLDKRPPSWRHKG